MKLAHIILVHNRPHQLRRLLKSLEHPHCKSFVHLDRKCDIAEFAFLIDNPSVEIVVDRQDVTWGGYSIVKAIMASMKQVTESNFDCDYINLISGQDYPLKSSEAFLSFLAKDPGKVYMEFHLPGHPWLKDAEQRLTLYHLTDFKFKGSTRLERLINFILPPQKMPENFEFIGHSGWFTLSYEAAGYVIDFFESNKSLVWKFKWSWGSDEILIQSVLYNSPFKQNIINNNLRYIDWSEGKASPKVLTMADQQELVTTSCFFGRKFDIAIDERILDVLDLEIRKETKAHN